MVGAGTAHIVSSYKSSQEWALHHPLAGWTHYVSAEGGFSVDFPTDPNIIHGQITAIDKKNPLTYLELKSYSGKHVCYTVGYLPMPKKWTWVGNKTLLKKILSVISAQDPQSELVSQQFVECNGTTALEYHLHAHGEDVVGRLLVSGDKLFRMTATTSSPYAHADVQSEAFFSSFSA